MTSEQGWGAPPPPPAAGWGGPPTYPPSYGYASPQTEGLAIGALVCAIGTYFVCPVVLAIVALVLAQNARNHIDDAGGRLSGGGLVTAARILAWIHLTLVILTLIGVIIAGFVLGARG